jgi:hypothetical protein
MAGQLAQFSPGITGVASLQLAVRIVALLRASLRAG